MSHPCDDNVHEPRRLDWDQERKGWPTVCRLCGESGFTQDFTIPRKDAA